jgi:hypothetical protein
MGDWADALFAELSTPPADDIVSLLPEESEPVTS